MTSSPSSPSRFLAASPWLGGALLLVSCASVLGIEETELQGAGGSGGAAVPEEWACVGKGATTKESSTINIPLVLLFSLTAPGNAEPAVGIQIDVCNGPLDVGCSNPSQTILTQPPGENQSAASITIPTTNGFDGYLRFSDPNDVTKDGTSADARTIPFRYYFSPRLSYDVTLPPVVLVGPKEFGAYLSVVGTAPNPDRGYLSATIFDCKTDPATASPLANNVQLQTTPELLGLEGVTAFQFINPTTPSSTPNAPTSNGTGPIGFLNATPGQYTVSAFPVSFGQVGSSRSVVVSKSIFTTVLMTPQ